MADGNASPAGHERGLLALNIPNARRFLRSGSSKESRPVTICGLNWKLEVAREEMNIGDGRKKELIAYLAATIPCTIDDAKNSNTVKAKCRLRVRHATDNDLEQEWTNSLTYDPETDDAEEELKFVDESWLASVQVHGLSSECG